MASPQPRIGVVTYPGSQDDRDALWALAALDAEAVPVWHEETRAARSRRGRAARRLLVRRLPPLRRDRALLAGDRGRRRVRRRGRARARDLQRLPDPLRGRAPPGRAPAERVAALRLPRRAARRRARRPAVHVALHAGPADRDPGQARRRPLVRAARARARARGEPPGRACATASRATARSTTSPASATSAATSWA